MEKIHLKIIAGIRRQKSMEKVIEFLRTLDFYFHEPHTVKLIPFKEGHMKYAWMLNRVRNKQNPSLAVGIKLWGKKNDKIIILAYGQHVETIRISWKDKADINFRKIIVRLKFPEYLNYDERRKWRTEYHKQLRNPNRVPSDWYLKILPDVLHI